MRLTLMLADAAQVADGKLYVLGGGWSVLNGAAPMAVALKVEVPWDQANLPHEWRLELLDQDGHPVGLGDPASEQAPVQVGGTIEVGRPAGLPPGTSLDVPLAVSFGVLPLQPGGYVWRVTIDGETHDTWHLAFRVR